VIAPAPPPALVRPLTAILGVLRRPQVLADRDWNAGATAASHPRPVIVSVRGNVAAFESTTFHSPGHEVWYGPTGTVVRRIANASSCGPPLGNCA
jgi:hypothetical protein